MSVAPDEDERPAGKRPAPRAWISAGAGWAAIIGGLVAVLIVASVVPPGPGHAGTPPPKGHGGSGPPPPPGSGGNTSGAAAQLGGPNGSGVNLTRGYLGVDVRAELPLGPSEITQLQSTPVRALRWPGGGLGDRFDPLGNGDGGLIYNDAGFGSAAESSFANFATACQTLSCVSIVTLPGEIDNPSYAARIVNYSQTTLHFEPTYWEIGNEPALWSHYGVPWTSWTMLQNLTPTPTQYASLVLSYASAVRGVDPAAKIVAPGGIGTGGNGSWIQTIVQADGPQLNGVAVHVYPAGNINAGQSLGAWFASLTSGGALPDRVPQVAHQITVSCPSCSLAILVDEFGTGTLGPANISLWNGYLAAYLAAEVVQGIPLPLASLDNYAFSGGYAGSWFNESGTPSAAYSLYGAMGQYWGVYARPWAVNSSFPGLLAASGGSDVHHQPNLLVVNTNATDHFYFDLARSYPNASRGVAWVFDGAGTTPVVASLNASLATNWSIPPMSVVIFSGLGAPAYALHAPAANGGPIASPDPGALRNLLLSPPTNATLRPQREIAL